tara:strand:+ start:4825 stop:7584 length:2760 start_codon:yes stop_codon:yes gene_type:complete
MQPVQYQGYSAQGAAFNPIVLSDNSRKILEQNEAFLQSLQAKQSFERNIQVAKLKQLQQNVESQRQQLNENFNYESRQRQNYNQSLQESAALEIQDLKRISALQPEKKTTAAVVNEVADFLVSTSKTAATVIGDIKKAKDQRDTAAATELLNSGGRITNAYVGMQVGGSIVYDAANNNIVATYASAKAFKESGYELQAGQKLIEVKDGVQAKLGLLDTEKKISTFSQRFSVQEEFQLDGETISRADYMQLDPESKKRAFEQQLSEEIKKYRDGASDHIRTKIDTLVGNKSSEFVGKEYKEYSNLLDQKVYEAARVQAIQNPNVDNLHEFHNISAIHNGNYADANSDIAEILNDPSVTSEAQKEAYYDSSSRIAPGVPLRESNALSYAETNRQRRIQEHSASKENERKAEIIEDQKIAMFRKATDEDRSDNNVLDDVRKAELAQLAIEAEAKGQYRFARILRANIAITSDQITIDRNKEEMDALYAQGRLSKDRVRNSGVMGQEFVDYMEKAEENQAVTAPTRQNLDVAKGYISNELNGRLTGGYGFKGTLPGSYEIAKDRALRQYEAVYRNEMRKSGDHTLAHDAGLGAFKADLGNDPTKGLYRIGNTLEDITAQLKSGERAGDFLDPSLKVKPREPDSNSITDLRARAEELGMDAIPASITPKRLAKSFDTFKSSGRLSRDPTIEVLSKALGIPYYEAHNYAAEKFKDESLKLPETITKGATEFESIAYNGPLRKFLNNPANIPREYITQRFANQVSGVTYDNPETFSVAARGSENEFDRFVDSLMFNENQWRDPTRENDAGSGATGLGQIMEDNIKLWSKEILGYEMTKDEFKANPEAQITIIRAKLKQYHNKYILRGESPDEAIRKAAADWYAGPSWETNYGPNFHNSEHKQVYNGVKHKSMLEYTTDILNRTRGR